MPSLAPRIALAQTNPCLGDLGGNARELRRVRARAGERHAELVVAPELALTGYPAGDLLLRRSFIDAVEREVACLVRDCDDGGPALLLGAPLRAPDATGETQLYNALLLVEGGRVAGVHRKCALPNYGVFDEPRYFTRGESASPIEWRGHKLGVLICEDMWVPEIAEDCVGRGAEILLVANAAPWHSGRGREREAAAAARVRDFARPLVFVNLVGGQDDLVFDGGSFALDARGENVLRLPSFETALALVGDKSAGEVEESLSEALRQALTLGLADYCRKNGFERVLLGLSGGIDSALTLTLAVDALGADAVQAVFMPSEYTADVSGEDARECARALGVEYAEIPIRQARAQLRADLKADTGGGLGDRAEQNLQARLRGVMLMTLANRDNALVLATGNKSELAIGYATLYGDMCGGFAPLADLYKGEVYALARHCNARRVARGEAGAIPQRILERAPSAELKPDQRDDDDLPPYPELDAILHALIERDLSVEQVAAQGFAGARVAEVQQRIQAAEHKRRQAPPGPRVSTRALHRERRWPITNCFREGAGE